MEEPLGSSLRHFDFNFRLPSDSLFLSFVNALLEKIRMLKAAGVFRQREGRYHTLSHIAFCKHCLTDWMYVWLGTLGAKAS